MNRMFIESSRVGTGNFSVMCGLVEGPVVAEVKMRDEEGNVSYFSLAEVEGIPNFFKTTYPTMDKQLGDGTDEAFFDELNECSISSGDYDEVFSDKENEYFEVFRYLIYIARSYEEVANEFINKTVNRYLDEIDIPMSDVEEDYIEWENNALN